MPEFKCQNIETLRKAKGLSISKMMQMLGHTREFYYQSWKKGNIKVKEIIWLHDFFNVSTDCILDLTEIKISESAEG